MQWRSENEGDVAVPDYMRCYESRTCLKSPVCDPFEAHAGDIVRSSLFGVADIPVNIIVPTVSGKLL